MWRSRAAAGFVIVKRVIYMFALNVYVYANHRSDRNARDVLSVRQQIIARKAINYDACERLETSFAPPKPTNYRRIEFFRVDERHTSRVRRFYFGCMRFPFRHRPTRQPVAWQCMKRPKLRDIHTLARAQKSNSEVTYLSFRRHTSLRRRLITFTLSNSFCWSERAVCKTRLNSARARCDHLYVYVTYAHDCVTDETVDKMPRREGRGKYRFPDIARLPDCTAVRFGTKTRENKFWRE